MPNIHVTCPKCRTELELDAEHAGQEIECGNCLAVFVATADKPAGRSGSGTSRRGSASDSGRGRSGRGARRRDDEDDRDRRRDEEDDDDYDGYDRPRRSRGAQNGLAVTSLVMGIVGAALVVAMFPIACIGGCCCAPLAWLPLPVTVPVALGAVITGALGVRKPEGKGMAITGIVLGALALAVAVLQLAFGFLPFMMVQPPAR